MESAREVTVLFFGAAADAAGTRQTSLTADGVSLDEVWTMIADRFPGVAPMRGTLAFALNSEYATLEDTVSAGDEIAVLPPVSGG